MRWAYDVGSREDLAARNKLATLIAGATGRSATDIQRGAALGYYDSRELPAVNGRLQQIWAEQGKGITTAC